MFVKTDHQAIQLDSGFELHRLFNIFFLRPDKTLDDVPDTVEVRLRNLIAIDANGNDLHIGANVLRIPKFGLVATEDIVRAPLTVSPNPVSDQLVIYNDYPESGMIYSGMGVPLLQLTSNDLMYPVNVESLPGGIYFLRFRDTGRVVKFVKVD